MARMDPQDLYWGPQGKREGLKVTDMTIYDRLAVYCWVESEPEFRESWKPRVRESWPR